MQHTFKALTLSYKTAPIPVRETVALNEINCKNLLDKINEFTEARDVLVLSTCNRTEVYYAAEKDLSRELIKLIAIEKGFFATKEVTPYFTSITDHAQAIEQLYNVSLGLESQVVGDMQILNQVKKAYQWAADANMAGPFLHRLMHTIFAANKRAVNETAFRDGAASVSYATVELVEELTKGMENPRVLMVGVGEIGADVCDNFQKSTVRNVIIANRTHHKAVALAQKTGATAVYWEQVWDEIKKADVVVSSVPGDCFFIDKCLLENQVLQTPKFFIDLSMPRSIDAELETLEGVHVRNIDNIRNRATAALEKRLAAVASVRQIVQESMAEFLAWAREMAMSPALQQFKNRLEEIRQREMARYLKNLGEAERAAVEAITKSMLNKIVKLPAIELKAACMRGESEALLNGLSALFQLEEKQEA
ncbi:glutamyl-tRNA reductase [Pontibacter mangrovi]|uniref:Glutamyl-tRNA reductase n=1 Tax=Pontibacter mangrovi TaxID=2589816 RepID=A0A501W9J9_9BACT|nr:glutamyl-tRNA reductase [Pontibacter mangrovi]TPE46279.1 glutamyl-tRNA reductase [Pontibacter mangrovi]